MNTMIIFLIGFLSGGWSCSYILNRHYRSTIWEMKEKLQIEQLKVRLKREEAKRTRYEKEIDEILRQRGEG